MFVHSHIHKQSKLDPRAHKCVFVGCTPTQKDTNDIPLLFNAGLSPRMSPFFSLNLIFHLPSLKEKMQVKSSLIITSTSIDIPESPTAEPSPFNPDVMSHKIHEVETVEAGSTTNDQESLVYSQRHPPDMDKSKDALPRV